MLWLNQRNEVLTSEGVYIQNLDMNGAVNGDRIVINQTFDVRSISSAWADGFGGLLVYSEQSKISAITFDTSGLSSAPQVLSQDVNRSPTAVFAGGGWTVGWLTPQEENPGTFNIVITQLSDQGEEIGEVKEINDVDANGRFALAYGNGIYAIAWSFPDPTVLEVNPRQIIGFRLLDETINEIGRFFVMDGTTDLNLSSLSWVSPSVFAIAWSQSPLSGEGSILGMSRINQLGQVLPSVIINEDTTLYSDIKVSGNASAMRVVMSSDLTPQPTGLFSTETFIQTGLIGPCEE